MSTPYVGEIRLFAGNFAPQGWLPCDGSLVPIADYDTLFQLIGTTYGGDGQTTFALPDLRGRVPVHQGNGYFLGQSFGVEAVTLTAQQLPAHTHPVVASSQPATHSAAAGNFFAQGEDPLYAAPGGATVTLGPTTTFGGGQPHDNLQPYLGLNFIISLFGIFPSP
jgi:microcystin-dependent protein